MIDSVEALIKAHEGLRLAAYQDTEGVWTCGYGCTGPDIGPGVLWTQQTADIRFEARLAVAKLDAREAVGPAFDDLNEPRQACLIDTAYQLGLTRLRGFKNMLAGIRLEDWPLAISELKASKLARQAPNRVAQNALILESGQWPQGETL